MTRLMRALTTSYVMYFNEKYERVGTLFQGVYKASWVGEGNAGDSYLVHLSRYIHLNPLSELQRSDPLSWPYSSYPYYLGQKRAQWIHPELILAYFGDHPERELIEEYRQFVESGNEDPRETIEHLTIE